VRYFGFIAGSISITVANVTTDVTNLDGFQEMCWSLSQYL
jgi:hypothetical protein